MRTTVAFAIFITIVSFGYAQDLSFGLTANDLSPHPMQALEKPGYLETVIDPSFGTTIRRISDAQPGENIRTMYSTVQAWNADESLMILYKRPDSKHILLNGMTYEYIKDLPINPPDLEEVFWHFENPDLLYYLDNSNQYLTEYNVRLDEKRLMANLRLLSECSLGMESGNGVQMMSWDSDVFTFRCGNEKSWAYTISTNNLREIQVGDLSYTTAMPFPSGQRFRHGKDVFDEDGSYALTMDIDSGNEHSCLGRDSEGTDHYYAVSFAQSPNGGCLGEVIAHNATTGECRTIVGRDLGYAYTQSGTHISSLAHKNTEGGWLVASMVGYDQDGQDLLDQELLIAQVTPDSANVYRIAHHRSDEDEYDYWGEPHPVMSPSGTRVLFNSDWSGSDDGISIDAYVVELPAYSISTETNEIDITASDIQLYPNPAYDKLFIDGTKGFSGLRIFDVSGQTIKTFPNVENNIININSIQKGLYFLQVQTQDGNIVNLKFVKM